MFTTTLQLLLSSLGSEYISTPFDTLLMGLEHHLSFIIYHISITRTLRDPSVKYITRLIYP